MSSEPVDIPNRVASCVSAELMARAEALVDPREPLPVNCLPL